MLYIEHDTNGTKWKWQSIKLTGTKPSPRTGMSVVANTIGKYSMSFIFRITSIMIQLIFFYKGNRAYFFGGVHDDQEDEEDISGSFFNDLYCLDLEKLNFNRSTDNFSDLSGLRHYLFSFESSYLRWC